MYEVTFLPILAAGVAAVIIGYIWFHPKVFGGVWMRLSGITPEMAERGKRRRPVYALAGLLAAMLVAYVMNYFGIAWQVYDMNYFGIAWQVYDWSGALQLGFWCWVGFTAPPMLGMVLWEQKPVRLYLIVALYWLVAMLVMAAVLLLGANMLSGVYSAQSNADSSSYSE